MGTAPGGQDAPSRSRVPGGQDAPSRSRVPSPEPAPRRASVTYEYMTVGVPRDRQGLYADSYAAFGRQVTSATSSPVRPGTVSLALRRERRIRHRAEVLVFQRRCEAELRSVAQIEQADAAIPTAVAIGVGIAGAAFMAAAVFSYLSGMPVATVFLGAGGAAGWALALPVHRRLVAERAAASAPELERSYELVYDSCEWAAALL